jgi:hypothetical protein
MLKTIRFILFIFFIVTIISCDKQKPVQIMNSLSILYYQKLDSLEISNNEYLLSYDLNYLHFYFETIFKNDTVSISFYNNELKKVKSVSKMVISSMNLIGLASGLKIPLNDEIVFIEININKSNSIFFKRVKELNVIRIQYMRFSELLFDNNNKYLEVIVTNLGKAYK